jgi:hypothetical protein
MNEHDSERIAGLMEADGLVVAASEADADVVVLNTCCIRENADNKLYGTLGHLKATKDARPGLEIVVAGCLAQKDRDLIQERAGHVDVVLGTHNVHRAVELLHQARIDGPVTEICALVQDAGADVEGLGRDAQGLGKCLQDLGARPLQSAFDLGDVRVAYPGHLGQLPQRELCRLALLTQVVAELVNGDRRELGHDPIMLALVSKCKLSKH